MKRIFQSIFLSLFIFITLNSFAQKSSNQGYFEGVVTYKVNYLVPLAYEMSSQIPTKMELYIQGTKTRMEMQGGRTLQIYIADPNTKMLYTLLHMVDKNKKLDEKVCFKQTPEEREKEKIKYPLPKLTYYDDSIKMILGYTCKKVTATGKDIGGYDYTANIWYTKAIGNHELNFSSPYPGIDGLLMEYELYSTGMEYLAFKFTVEKIEKKSVKDKLFKVPSKYKETTLTELRKKYGAL